MTLREEFEKEHNWVDKKEQPMFMSVKYIHWLEAKVKQLQNVSSNSDYAKCRKDIIKLLTSGGEIDEQEIDEVLKKHFA